MTSELLEIMLFWLPILAEVTAEFPEVTARPFQIYCAIAERETERQAETEIRGS